MKHNLFTPKYIAVIHFETRLSMFGLAPSTMEEGAEGLQNSQMGCGGLKGPQPSVEARMRGVDHPELLIYIS